MQPNSPTLVRFQHPVLELPLTQVMRPEIALPLQHVLNVYTVGNLLAAWRNPKTQYYIEQMFDSADQARHAIAVCAGWMGRKAVVAGPAVSPWWMSSGDWETAGVEMASQK